MPGYYAIFSCIDRLEQTHIKFFFFFFSSFNENSGICSGILYEGIFQGGFFFNVIFLKSFFLH